MRYEGVIEAPVPREKFYQFITDPKKVLGVIPDVVESEIVDSDHFRVKAKVGMAYVRGTVSLDFEIAEKRKNSFAKLVGRGQGIQSSIDLTMAITLQDSQGGTRASWVAEANVGGLLASVGGRLLGSVAEKYIRQITEAIRLAVAK
jgi:carbon monoxide dehydrogenase subunit G